MIASQSLLSNVLNGAFFSPTVAVPSNTHSSVFLMWTQLFMTRISLLSLDRGFKTGMWAPFIHRITHGFQPCTHHKCHTLATSHVLLMIQSQLMISRLNRFLMVSD